MSQWGVSSGLATRRAIDAPVGRRPRVAKPRRQELEAKLVALQRDYAELHTAIFEAAQVHRRLCAPRLVRYGDFEIASEIFAVRHLPGDFFTVRQQRNGVMLALGDICGKGLAAGMWTTHLVGLTNRHAAVSADPATIIAGVNRDLGTMAATPVLASLFLGRLDPVSGRLEYCSAGHPPTFLLRANGDIELLSAGGMLLGVTPDAAYVNGVIRLKPADTVAIYSDGIIESLNENGEEFGQTRLREQLRRSRSNPAEAMLFSVLGAVQDFAATRRLMDDMSLAVIRRAPIVH